VDGVFRVHEPEYESDGASIAANGLAYGRESSGFHDWLRRGIPEPKDPTTLFAELRSVEVPPVLWATGGWVGIPTALLVADSLRTLLEDQEVTGVAWAPVEIVKVATKGRRQRRRNVGEPEDQILRARNALLEAGPLPVLWGVRVVGMCAVSPDAAAWDDALPTIQSYHFVEQPATDLFRASRNGKQYGGQVFCSQRFRELCQRETLSNIAFTSFHDWRSRHFGRERAT
jgi:hypothetical protein